MNTTFWEIVETLQGICLSLPVKLLWWMLPILLQCSHFQEINYGSIIKKSYIHHLFCLDCNQFTVENWSEQFVRGLEVRGRPSMPEVLVSVCGVLSVVFSPAKQASPDCAQTFTHTHTDTHFLTIFEVPWHWWLPNHIHLQYPFIHCVKRPRPA